MHWRTLLFGLACLAASVATPEAARAQTTSGPTLGPPPLKYPERLDANGNDLNTTGSRPQNLTPLGISYQDCIDNQQLRFSVAVSGFQGQDIRIWATKTGTCSNDTERSNGGIPDCWPLPRGIVSVNQVSTSTYQFTVRVQDIIGPQNAPPNPPVYRRYGSEACSSQQSSSSETFSVWFIPIQNGNAATGTAYQYTPLSVDLVGPAAPIGVSDSVGDTLFTLSWTPNGDVDTTGYDVYLSPIRGQEGNTSVDASADASLATPEPTLVCPDAGTSTVVNDASNDASVDATVDATVADASVDAAAATATDAGCHYVNVAGPPASAACGSAILQGAVIQDGGAMTVVDEAGEGGTSIEPGNGGISTIPTKYLVGSDGINSLSISDKSVGSYMITGLRNGTTYTAVVSAVDAFGNIGPPSTEKCDYPAPVNDFWENYRSEGGRAGGFCALEAVGGPSQSLAGVALAASLAAIVRRRRRRDTP